MTPPKDPNPPHNPITITNPRPDSIRDQPSTWWTEKNTLSIGYIQTPHEPYTEYYMTKTQIDQTLTKYILAAILIFLIGVFL